MNKIALEALISLPEKDLKTLSFCKTDSESLKHWVAQLPIADMSASTRLLYCAIQEVCRLTISPAVLMEFIEILRPPIHFACEGLQKNYLNKAIILPEQPRKVANLSQALRKHLSIATLSVVLQSQKKMGALLIKPSALFNKAIFYTLVEYEAILTCNYLLYRPLEENFWLKIHSLFNLSLQHKLSQKNLRTNGNANTSTVENIYHQLMLWGCIKANQLRQDDIRALKDYMPGWAALVFQESLSSSNANGLIIDPDIDMPPLYQKFHRDTTSERCLSINTIDLITELTPLSDPLLQAKSKLSPNLISHLILAWGIFSDRTFMRLDTHSELSICIGLSTSHFYLGDHLPFEDLVYGKDGAPDQIHVKTGQTRQDPPAKVGNSNFNKSTQTKLDAWDESLYGKKTLEKTSVSMESIGFHLRSGGKSQMSETGSDKEKYHNYRVNVLNMSPGGYCVEWNHLAPGSIKSGEIISVKGEHHNNWHIGVIRWVKQTKEKGLQLGIELISPSAAPYGAKFVALSGEDKTDFLRVLLLPEISAAGQAASIITPSLSFKPGQHIHLMLNGEEQTILLRELLTSTGSYSQFSFDTVKPLNSDSTSPWHSNQASDAGDIDSVWEIL